MDVWCLRLESIPSQITDSLYVQLSHAIAVRMTFDLQRDVQMQCLLFVTRHGPRQPLSCVTKVKKYELKNDTESLEERVSCGCFHREDLLWFQSHPVCTWSTERFGNSLRFFIVNDMSVWLFIKLYFHTLWRIRSANRKSSADFLMLFRWRSFFWFVSAYFCTIDVI